MRVEGKEESPHVCVCPYTSVRGCLCSHADEPTTPKSNPLPPPPAPSQFYGFLSPLLERLRMDVRYLQRNLNEGFSGGEKKRNEILQLAVRDRGRGVGLRIRCC